MTPKTRTADISNRPKIKERLEKIHDQIEDGFRSEAARQRQIADYWDIYNCILGSNQAYQGNSETFIPSVYQAINARITRFINQIFPFSGRHIEAVSTDAQFPRARAALGEHYIRISGLKSAIQQFLTNKDVEGHGWLYVSWNKRQRYTVERVKRSPSIDIGAAGEVSDIEDRTVEDAYPMNEILADADVLVCPSTADTLEDAIQEGGHITILRRWGKAKIEAMIEDGVIDKKKGTELLDRMSGYNPAASSYFKDRAKQSLYAAGIKGDRRQKYALIFQTFINLELEEGMRLCEVFFAGKDLILHAHRNPLWSDLLPLIGSPAIKLPGSAKGKSPVSTVSTLQYFVNDIANLGRDSAARGLRPITLTDPSANPHYDTMKTADGALWLADPRTTSILQFPELWKDSAGIIQNVDGVIKTTLGVNPSMLSQYQRTGKQPNQALVAQEQAVDLLTTSFEVSAVEQNVLSKWLRLVMEMDKQYRDAAITVQSFGEMGMSAMMEELPPLQEDKKTAYLWYGVEQVRNEQRLQTQLGLINIVKSIPPQMYQGYMLDISPALLGAFDQAFGPRVGRLVFKDVRSQLTLNPELENELIDQGHDIGVHVLDDHQTHMAAHLKSMQEAGDETGGKARHLFKHQVAASSNARAQQEAASPQGQPGPQTGARQRPPGRQKRPSGAIPLNQTPLASQQPRGLNSITR
jgi:hypothetical protein